MYFLLPSRLVCLRLWTKSEMGSCLVLSCWGFGVLGRVYGIVAREGLRV